VNTTPNAFLENRKSHFANH